MRAAVLGHPIAHSLSPLLHRAAHSALGLAGWDYQAIDVAAPELPAFVAAMDDGWAGLSLTMPLKAAVMPLLAEVSDLARAVGAVNTVVAVGPPGGSGPRPASGMAWRGENTDVHGIVAALEDAGVRSASTAAVLGGGATAASSLAALAHLGAREVVVHVRRPSGAQALSAMATRLGLAVRPAPWPSSPSELAALADGDVVVSTVPAGATDQVAAGIAAGGRPRAVLLDVVYAPRPTALLAAWAVRGGTGIDGTAMLLHQAGEQVRLMTGRAAPLAQMRACLEGALVAAARG